MWYDKKFYWQSNILETTEKEFAETNTNVSYQLECQYARLLLFLSMFGSLYSTTNVVRS